MEPEYVEPVRAILTAARGQIAGQPDIAKGYNGPIVDGELVKGEGVYGPWPEGHTCSGLALTIAGGDARWEEFEVATDWAERDERRWTAIETAAMRHFIEANHIPKVLGVGEFYYFQTIATWNDQAERTKADVVEAFDHALAELPA